jgi:hypothetical protein
LQRNPENEGLRFLPGEDHAGGNRTTEASALSTEQMTPKQIMWHLMILINKRRQRG